MSNSKVLTGPNILNSLLAGAHTNLSLKSILYNFLFYSSLTNVTILLIQNYSLSEDKTEKYTSH